MTANSPTAEQIVEFAEALQLLLASQKHNQMRWFKPYAWQRDMYAAGRTHAQRLLMAGNRVGKTASAAYEVALHLTGLYPDNWPGVRFTQAPTVWVAGVSGEQLRDVLQAQIFGRFGANGLDGAMVPAELIGKVTRTIGTPNLAKDVLVKHVSGGESLCSLKSYSQGPQPLMGSSVDFVLIDEQPAPDCYGQLLTRTMTGNRGKGGSLLMVFTPENGIDDVLRQWMDDIKPGQWMKTITWDDAPHLTPEVQTQLLDAIPVYQRKMRKYGIPLMGAGMVFEVSEERYVCDPPDVKEWWRVCAAVDFGFGHNFATVWTVHDTDSDVIYVIDEYAESEALPPVHVAAIRARGAEIPVIYPHDGDNTEKSSGETLATYYLSAGAKFVAKFSNIKEGDHNLVAPGILEINTRLQSQRLKISNKCTGLLAEMRQYHRDDKGKIVKTFDDLVDAMRYSVMSVGRYGLPWGERHRRNVRPVRAVARMDY